MQLHIAITYFNNFSYICTSKSYHRLRRSMSDGFRQYFHKTLHIKKNTRVLYMYFPEGKNAANA